MEAIQVATLLQKVFMEMEIGAMNNLKTQIIKALEVKLVGEWEAATHLAAKQSLKTNSLMAGEHICI
jgi:hypothetical protein